MTDIVNHDPLCFRSRGIDLLNPLSQVCICNKIGQARSEGYKKGWDDAARFASQQSEARLSRNPRRTSVQAVQRNADSIKGLQRDVYNALAVAGYFGYTDFDLEDITGRSHQSVSAARNALMMAGLVTDSGKTRPNARGNPSIVWILASPESKETNAGTADPGPVDLVHTCNGVSPTVATDCPACVDEFWAG